MLQNRDEPVELFTMPTQPMYVSQSVYMYEPYYCMPKPRVTLPPPGAPSQGASPQKYHCDFRYENFQEIFLAYFQIFLNFQVLRPGRTTFSVNRLNFLTPLILLRLLTI